MTAYFSQASPSVLARLLLPPSSPLIGPSSAKLLLLQAIPAR